MNREAALASLGLSGHEDNATVAQVYGQRLSAVQERLIAAQNDSDRSQCQTTLAQLVEAYELVTGSGRHTQARAGDSATVMRSGTELAAAHPGDTLVRMEPGAVLSQRLEIGELLGQGGMGNVYAARDRLKNEDVAIKVLRQDLLFSNAAQDRFLAEAKVSCSLSHPNIVRVHDVGISGNFYYFSMERLKGHTLRQRIEAYHHDNREFAVAEVADIARQLIDALRYAHRYIVHRDIKPENVWLADDGTVKLMDFGIARAYSNSQLTQTGMTLGTAYYMAPEQRTAAKEVDWRADQYALGVVLYELLAGQLPMGAVKPLETVRRELPKRFARALMRAMSPKPEDRFASLNQLLGEIEAPERRIAAGLGSLLLIGAGVAAAAGGAYMIVSKQQGAAPVEQSTAAIEVEPASEQPAASEGSDRTEPPDSARSTNGRAGAPPPPSEPSTAEPNQVAAATVLPAAKPEQAAAQTPPAGSSQQPVAKSTHVAALDRSRTDARRQECITQCERDGGECRSLNRRGKQDCMRAVAFGSSGQLTTTNPAAAHCAFFGESRCEHAFNRDACVARVALRYQACVQVLGGSIASRRQDCEDKARESDKLCLDESRDCRAGCE